MRSSIAGTPATAKASLDAEQVSTGRVNSHIDRAERQAEEPLLASELMTFFDAGVALGSHEVTVRRMAEDGTLAIHCVGPHRFVIRSEVMQLAEARARAGFRRARKPSSIDRVLALVGRTRAEISVAEVAHAVGIRPLTADGCLRRLARRGLVQKTSRDVWRATPAGRRAVR